MCRAFYKCTNFNQPINVPESVTNMSYAFYECTNFNQPINIPENVTNMSFAFTRCLGFNQPINIPGNVTNSQYLLTNVFGVKDIKIADGLGNNVFTGLFTVNSLCGTRNIWTGPLTAANLLTTNIMQPSNGNARISTQIRPTWTSGTNCYYNTYYNIYIYTNTFDEVGS